MQEAREEPSMESSSPRTFRQKMPADVERTGQKRESGLDDSSGLVAIPSAVLLSASGSLGLSAKRYIQTFPSRLQISSLALPSHPGPSGSGFTSTQPS